MSYTGVLGAIPSSSTPLKTTIIQDPLSASSNIQLDANGNTYLVPVTGNVGIGTTSPGYKLTTVGTSAAGGIYSAISNTDATAGSLAGYVGIANGTNNYFVLSQAVGGVTTLSNAGAAGLTIQTAQAQPLIFATTATERMRIDSSGNVGIGTTSPNARLSLNVSGAGSVTTLNLTNDNTGFASGTGPAINFGVASSAGSYGKLEVLNQTATSGSNSYMAFSTRGGDVLAERMRIDASGNVGIGTTSPVSAAKLNISSSDAAYQIITSGTTNGIRFGTTSTYSFIEGVDKTGSSSYQPLVMGGSVLEYTIAGSERMRIDSSGNVGIGTSSPGAKLHVANATGGTAIYAGNANASLYVNYLDGGVNYIGGSTTVVRNGAGTTEFMRIDSSGNVGIGIALPAVNLDIYNSGTAAIRVQGDSTTQAQFSRFSTDASAPFILLKKARGTTASPVAVATGDIMGQVIYQAYGGTNNRNLGSINGIVTAYTSDTNIASALTFTTSAAGGVTAVEAMRIDSSGNVGIGTTSPNASAILDAQSTTKGVRFPNMTTTQKNAISSPAAGLVVFDTTLAKLCVYSGSAWQTITSI